MPGANYAFSITHQQTNVVDPDTIPGLKLRVSCTAASGPDGFADRNIFLYQREERASSPGTYDSFFVAIATPDDLESVPDVVEPHVNAVNPVMFRLDYMESHFHSYSVMEECLRLLKSDVSLLVTALEVAADHLSDPVTEVIT